MSRITITIGVIVAIPLLLILVLALVLANPGSYKDEIKAAAKTSTGFEVEIGKLSWGYWPPVSLDLADLRIGSATAPLMTVETAALKLDVIALLTSGSVDIQRLSVSGVRAYPTIDKAGKANWESGETSAEFEPSGEASAASSEAPVKLSIAGITVRDVEIQYKDESAGDHYTAQLKELETGAIAYGKPTAIKMALVAIDESDGSRYKTDLAGQFTIEAGMEKVTFSNLALRESLTFPDTPSLTIEITGSGTLLLKDKTRFEIDGNFDTSKLKGFAEYGAGPFGNDLLTFDFRLDEVNADPYLSDEPATPAKDNSAKPAGKSAGSPKIADSELIPVESLKGQDVKGKLSIGTLHYDGFTFSPMTLDVRNEKGQLNVETTLAGYGGTIVMRLRTALEGKPTTTVRNEIKGMDITQLAGFESLTGTLQMDSDLSFRGSMMSEAMNTMNGASKFMVIDGTLDVRPIKKVAATIDQLRGKTSSVAGWPDTMPFKQLNGVHAFHDGTRSGQELNFTLENIAVNGQGGFDYFADTIDYKLSLQMSQTESGQFQVNETLANIRWPLHCRGAMTASAQELCLSDTKAVQELVTEIARQELKRKGKKELDKVLEEKAPEKLKGLLKGLLGN